MSKKAISVESLGKAYHIGLKEEDHDSLIATVGSWVKAPLRNFKRLGRLDTKSATHKEVDDIFWALRDVSFEVKRGEVVGIIGRNGAGKSTLLKILSRITEPTTGRAIIRGRVSSLLEVGTGFHPELSGRENVYMNGTILGMTKREIDRKFDEIVDFSGVEKFLDTPVKRYSSGMKVRLAFAVAAHLEPEILIIDEVLAVGDAEFQKKCLGKMQNVATGGRTVLFVSHNMTAVENLCHRAIYLSKGAVTSIGSTQNIIEEYYRASNCHQLPKDLLDASIDRSGSGEAVFTQVTVTSGKTNTSENLALGDPIRIEIRVRAKENIRNAVIGIGIYAMNGRRITGLNSADTGNFLISMQRNENVLLRCELPFVNIMPGRYYLNVQLKDSSSNEIVDQIQEVVTFDINVRDVYQTGQTPVGPAIIYLPVEWQQVS